MSFLYLSLLIIYLTNIDEDIKVYTLLKKSCIHFLNINENVIYLNVFFKRWVLKLLYTKLRNILKKKNCTTLSDTREGGKNNSLMSPAFGRNQHFSDRF